MILALACLAALGLVLLGSGWIAAYMIERDRRNLTAGELVDSAEKLAEQKHKHTGD